MKKITLLLASTLFSLNALSGPYVKLSGGAAYLNTLKLKSKEYDEDLGSFDLNIKAKSDITPFGEIAIGYSVLENLRAEISAAYFFNPEAKGDATNKLAYNKIPIIANTNVKLEATINTFLASGEVDLFDLAGAKVFVGAGIGLSQIKQKIKTELRLANDLTKQSENVLVPTVSTKKANNFSYSFSLGATVQASENAHVVLVYFFRDFGKTNSAKDSSGKSIAPKTHYKGHHLALGFRLDI